MAIGALGLLAVAGIAGLIIVYTGAYNVAATEQHMSFTRWAFDTTMHQSIERRAEEVTPVDNITPAMLSAGASAYKSMCQQCHAGPGVEREQWAAGMRPQPPYLVEAAAEWEPSEVYWIVKHGIKMSGMPAFGTTHDEEALRSIAAFVKQLPAMSPERYAASGAAAGSASGHSASGAHHQSVGAASADAAEAPAGGSARP
jgi:mono/diheme cytochrome c family protein